MGRGRGIPGIRPMIGSHRTTPAHEDDDGQRRRGPRPSEDWAATSGGRHRPDQEHGDGDDGRPAAAARGRSTASTGAGRVSQPDEVVGQAGQEERGHGQDQDAPLQHQRGQRPVGGQVAERPAHGRRR